MFRKLTIEDVKNDYVLVYDPTKDYIAPGYSQTTLTEHNWVVVNAKKEVLLIRSAVQLFHYLLAIYAPKNTHTLNYQLIRAPEENNVFYRHQYFEYGAWQKCRNRCNNTMLIRCAYAVKYYE